MERFGGIIVVLILMTVLGGIIFFSVRGGAQEERVNHPQQDTTNIQVSSLNSVSQVLSISEQTYNPPSIATGSHEETIFEWVLKNTADLPIIDIPYQIILYKNDQPIRIDNGLYTNPILQGEPAAISMKADISAAKKINPKKDKVLRIYMYFCFIFNGIIAFCAYLFKRVWNAHIEHHLRRSVQVY